MTGIHQKASVLAVVLVALLVPRALAQGPVARVADVTRLQGQGTNVLLGYGLVTGLNQTGDDSKFLPTIQALKTMMERLGTSVESVKDISAAKNVAIAMIEVVVPEHGAREGDLLDVSVTALAAESLAGGRLLPSPLIYHEREVDGLFGFAQGAVIVDDASPASGMIRRGARMERDVFINVLATGEQLRTTGLTASWIKSDRTYLTLVLDDVHAGWSMAAAVAQAVDKELGVSVDVERVAVAVDSKNIVVLLPDHQRNDPASWIRDVEQTPILIESNEARVTIDEAAGTIVVTGDTRLSPVIVSQRGMTVTVALPGPDGATPQPTFERNRFVALDAKKDRMPNVRSLLEALNQLKVPFKDRVSVLEQIHRAGKLHARLIYKG